MRHLEQASPTQHTPSPTKGLVQINANTIVKLTMLNIFESNTVGAMNSGIASYSNAMSDTNTAVGMLA
jgi:hypothetical protein